MSFTRGHAATRGFRRRRSRGQAVVEFALIIPVFLLLLLAAVDVGRLFFTYIQANNAAREGAAYGAANAASPTLTSGVQAAAFQEANVQSQAGQSAQSDVTVTPVCHNTAGTQVDCSTAPGGIGTGNTITVSVAEPFTFFTPLINGLFHNSFTMGASATAAVVGLAPGSGGTPPAQCTQLPTASFTVSASGNAASVDASASTPSTGDCAIATYEWNFMYGVSDCSLGPPSPAGCDLVGKNKSYTYPLNGAYTIRLEVRNPNGVATTTRPVTVPASISCTVKPMASFTYHYTHSGNNYTTTFTDASDPIDPTNCPILTWAWTFAGGNPSSSNVKAPPNVAFDQHSHTVTLIVTNAAGDSTPYVDTGVK
jgi:Flp pilus assembly protein TadG